MAFQLDTSGVVPFEGGTLGVISWEGIGQRGGLFAQGYVRALFQDLWDKYPLIRQQGPRPRFDWLAPETLARIMEDCGRASERLRDATASGGAAFWRMRQRGDFIGGLFAWRPLTPYLGDDGLIRFKEVA